jgi:preprotein translocase subunit SecG
MEIVLCLFSLFLIAVVLLQSGRTAGLSGDIAGGAETFLGKSKAKGYEGTLKKLTKVAAVGMMVLAVALVLLQVYVINVEGTPEGTPSATSTPAPTLSNPTESESASAATSEEATASATVSAAASESASTTTTP